MSSFHSGNKGHRKNFSDHQTSNLQSQLSEGCFSPSEWVGVGVVIGVREHEKSTTLISIISLFTYRVLPILGFHVTS